MKYVRTRHVAAACSRLKEWDIQRAVCTHPKSLPSSPPRSLFLFLTISCSHFYSLFTLVFFLSLILSLKPLSPIITISLSLSLSLYHASISLYLLSFSLFALFLLSVLSFSLTPLPLPSGSNMVCVFT